MWENFKFRSQLDGCSGIYFFQVNLTEIEKLETWLMLVGNMETGEEGGDRFHLMSQISSILLYFGLVILALELDLWLLVFTNFLLLFVFFSICFIFPLWDLQHQDKNGLVAESGRLG